VRIFYAAGKAPNASLSSDIWRNNLYLPLVELGHDVVEFAYDLDETFRNMNMVYHKSFIEENRPKLSAELLRQIEIAHNERPIDIFFSYFYDVCVFPETIDMIRAMGIKTINWYCNGSYQLDLVSQISPHYDWCLVPERFRLDDYRAMGAHPLYCQEAANPALYHPFPLPKEFDVTFAGQVYGDRPAYIKYLLRKGFNVHVWGVGWENFAEESSSGAMLLFHRMSSAARRLCTLEGWDIVRRKVAGMGNGPCFESLIDESLIRLPRRVMGGILSDTDLVRLYSRSKINLGFSSCGETHRKGERVLQLRLRDFEVPMSGGFYMVEYMEELEEFFEIGKEIVCYHDPDDLVDKIRYYLNHENEREDIARAGRERCLKDHTWQKRFMVAFREMGL